MTNMWQLCCNKRIRLWPSQLEEPDEEEEEEELEEAEPWSESVSGTGGAGTEDAAATGGGAANAGTTSVAELATVLLKPSKAASCTSALRRF